MLYDLYLLFISFVRSGLLGYGGGPSMIPLVQVEVVEMHKWMTQAEFLDALAIGYTLPGPIVTKMAAVVGYKVSGVLGAIVALLGVVLPSVLLLLLIFLFYRAQKDNPIVEAVLRGVRPVILAMLLYVVYDMAPGSIDSLKGGLLGIAALFFFIFTSVHPAIAVVVGGIAGFFLFR